MASDFSIELPSFTTGGKEAYAAGSSAVNIFEFKRGIETGAESIMILIMCLPE